MASILFSPTFALFVSTRRFAQGVSQPQICILEAGSGVMMCCRRFASFTDTNEPYSHVFGLCEGVEVPRENPCMHRENMQTCRKTPGWHPNPGHYCCKAVELSTVPPCSSY
ncbi:hypothetical protein ILYODFUR_017876 [Ilyodon furcidens]|uniref:Secreted protein n=1 Tax=Ilyodon furcidens TaxID=33524 RepID=A0ABV0SZE0_9TELE